MTCKMKLQYMKIENSTSSSQRGLLIMQRDNFAKVLREQYKHVRG